MKNVLILCTGNSCRSIIAEALLNHYLADCVQAFSSGVSASGRVHPDAKKILQEKGLWQDSYYSKTLDKVMDKDYDLVITVCGNAQESCPVFNGEAQIVHIGFEDPDGHPFEVFEKTYHEINSVLVPKVATILC